ncbi:PLP-dependent aminotransferase family protein [Streptomyces monticola]|uniref:PLP-dependent aminotransferase family protein n=1 Tax=Streptomyces monticola TaxID=2666263 RepID=A0ABW2JIC3_9ACTN
MDRSNESPSERSITSAATAPTSAVTAPTPQATGPHSPGTADFLQLDAADAPPGGLADWLTRELRRAVADGRLPVGSRLPATRALATELRVSRGVVTEAYRRLTEDGRLAGRGRGGTVVVAAPAGATAVPRPAPASAAPPSTAPAPALSAATPDIWDVIRNAPARIDLSPGRPDLTAFPRTAWLRAERAVLGDLPSAGLGYGDPRGTPELRRAVATWLALNRGISADPDEILIVAGTAQALDLTARVLRADGISTMAMEDPGSLGVRQHLQAGGLTTPPVPVDAEGLRVDALRDLGAPAVLLTPAHQFPMGVVLAGGRRRELLRWAADSGVLVFEDDYDAEHRYDRPPVPALRPMLPERVLYAGSVSKLLAPALRVGWLLAPPKYRDALIEAKRFADLGNATLPQLVLARLLESGALERHLRLVRGRHRRRRDAMVTAVRTQLPGATVHGAAAGLHVTITFDSTRPDTELAAAALERGVKTHPLSWHTQRPGAPGLLLGYAATPTAAITEGIGLLGKAL